MRVELITDPRVGITKNVLDVFARHGHLLRGIETAWCRIYIDVPQVTAASGLTIFTTELLEVPGVRSVREIDLLPSERRRMHFDALMGALTDPVLAVDDSNRVIAANDAAVKAFGMPDANVIDCKPLEQLLGNEASLEVCELVSRLTGGEVSIHGRPMLMDVLPVAGPVDDDRDWPHGAVLIFRSPTRLGQDIYGISKRKLDNGSVLIGESPAMRRIGLLIGRLGPIDAPLLITGETGTGKELVARACHMASSRVAKPFLALNCAALPENLIESELFGYAPGAFSGAQKNGKPGMFELADGGTVLLDEVGEMSPYLQAKILRFLQDNTFMRVGGKLETRVSVRILAATHRDLLSMVDAGSFRVDLYYRLHVLTMNLPPLRERREDIPTLARHFMRRAAAQVPRAVREITDDALELLGSAEWPGNVRQLENTLFRAVSLAEGHVLGVDDVRGLVAGVTDFPIPSEASRSKRAEMPASEEIFSGETYAQTLKRLERVLLTRLYSEYPSTRKLAKRLGLSHTAVGNKLRRLNIT